MNSENQLFLNEIKELLHKSKIIKLDDDVRNLLERLSDIIQAPVNLFQQQQEDQTLKQSVSDSETQERLEHIKQWEANKKYFEDYQLRFEKDYAGKYVAILDGEVIGTGDQSAPLAGSILKKYGNVPLYVDKPGGEEAVLLELPIA